MDPDLEAFLGTLDLTDPNTIRRLPTFLHHVVRPELFWTCANCLCARQPTAEYVPA